MKKLFAILLAALMLLSTAAFAEEAYTFSFANPVATVDMGGEAMTFDLNGLSLNVTISLADEKPVARLDIVGADASLFGADLLVDGEKAYVTFDGVDGVYCAKMPVAASSIASFEMPDIDIEGLMETVMGAIEIGGDEGSMTFKVPYTAVNEVLSAIAPALSGMEIGGVDLTQVADAIEQLKASDSGVNIEGTYAETEAGMALSVSFIPVQNVEAASEPIATVDVEIGEAINVDITVDGAALHFGMYSEGDVVKVNIAVNAEGMSAELTGDVTFGETDAELAAFSTEGAIDLEEMDEEQGEAFVEALTTAASGLLGYVFTALGAAA